MLFNGFYRNVMFFCNFPIGKSFETALPENPGTSRRQVFQCFLNPITDIEFENTFFGIDKISQFFLLQFQPKILCTPANSLFIFQNFEAPVFDNRKQLG